MAAPANLSIGDTFSDGGMEYEVLSVVSGANGQYQLRFLGLSSIYVPLSSLLTRDDPILIVEGSKDPADDGLYVYQNSTLKYVKQIGYNRVEGTTGSTTGGEPPTIPINLAAQARSDTSISLTWTPTTGASGYAIFVLGDDKKFKSLGAVSTTQFIDQNLDPDTTYTYKISAINISGSSALTGSVRVTTLASSAPPVEVGAGGEGTSLDLAQYDYEDSSGLNVKWRKQQTFYSDYSGGGYAEVYTVDTGGNGTPVAHYPIASTSLPREVWIRARAINSNSKIGITSADDSATYAEYDIPVTGEWEWVKVTQLRRLAAKLKFHGVSSGVSVDRIYLLPNGSPAIPAGLTGDG